MTSAASNGESVLEALSAAELITVKTHKGRPQTIQAGKPVYQAAFQILTADNVLRSRLDLSVLTELTKIETKNIDKYETELNLLGSLPKQPREVAPRVDFLLAKLAASQGMLSLFRVQHSLIGTAKVEAWEKEMGVLKKVLTTQM
jgi:hypothetical protein